jgi:dienelactone hydrolase
MTGKFAFAVLTISVLCVGCAQVPKAVKTTLSEQDVGTIRFTAKPLVLQRGKQDGSSGKSPGFSVANDQSIELVGDLAFPAGTGPFPAVVFAHGCSGTGYADKAWAPLLREWGYATFVVDSFRPRGYSRICEDAQRLYPLERVPDVYGALNVLSSHPKIDPKRIALMGASHGGLLTIDAATQWAKDTFAQNGQGYRAFFPIYPYCNVSVPEFGSISAPVRVHTGELDDWTPAKPCEKYVAALKTTGQDAEIHVYPNAHHAFDDPTQKFFYGANFQSAAKCWWRGPSILASLSLDSSSCFSRGATVGGNIVAMEAARVNVRAELAQLMK